MRNQLKWGRESWFALNAIFDKDTIQLDGAWVSKISVVVCSQCDL